MRSRAWLGLLGSFLAGVAVTILLFPSGRAVAQEARAGTALKGDVILLRCNATGDLAVTAYQGSPGTPGKKSGSCAESISVLLKEGFLVHNVGHYDDEKMGFALVTLAR